MRTKSKNKLLFYFLFLTIVGPLLNGCTTEIGVKPKVEFTPLEAQSWFQEHLEHPVQNSSIGGRKEGILDIKKEVLWKQAKSYKTTEGTSLIVPVWFENNYRLAKKTVRHLKIYKDKKGIFQHEFIEFLATDEHLKKYGKVDFKNFSGTVSIHDWKAGIRKGYQIENGTAVGYVTSYSIGQKKKPNPNGGRVLDCGYQYSSYNYSPITKTYSDFTIVWVSIACYPSNSYQWYYSEPYDYSAFVASNYGCEVTNTCVDANPPYYYSEPEPVDYEKQARDEFNYYKIDDSKLKPCMQIIVGELKGITNGSVADIIQKFSGAIPSWNWEIKDGLLASNINGITSALNRSSGTVTTTIDTQKFLSSTDIAIARTLMHESIHAYLVGFFANDPVLANGEYYQMITAWNTAKRPDLNELQHDEMVRSFVNDIAAALSQYSYSKGYDIPYQTQSDLSWGGLQDTKAFKNLPYSDRKRINDTISIEQYGIDSYGNAKVQNGRPANC